MTDPPCSFNLWTAPWIRVTREDGSSAELGIGACLADAHTLVGLHDPSPLVAAGTHRLLAAILQAICVPQDLGEIAALLRAGQFDPGRLAMFAEQHAARFDLFHPSAPFLQTGDVPLDGTGALPKDLKPAAYLFSEVPAATNRTHFHHVLDEGHKICPACCARGIVTVPAFASSGGPGIRPSINGVPPIYVLPTGASLFETLALSITAPGFRPPTADPQRADMAAWSSDPKVGKGVQVSAVGYLESLTFPARRMRLYPQAAAGACTQCGSPTQVVVGTMHFEMGHWLSEGSAMWEDPFAAFRKPKGKGKAADTGPKPVRPEDGKAFWREYSGLLLAEREDLLRPRIVQQLARLIDRSVIAEEQRVRFRCVGLRTDGKAKIFEWTDEALEAPPALLSDIDAAGYIEQALQRADEVRFVLESSFDSHFRPERDKGGRNEKLVRFKTVRARMTADYWRRLAPLFRRLVFDLADEMARETVEQAWATTLVRQGRLAFDQAAAQIGSRADALRARVEAQAACYGRLAKKRKEWFGE